MKDALILALLAIVAWLALGQRQESQPLLIDDVRGGQVRGAQAVTDPGGVRALRVAPCVTIEPEDPPAGDDA